MPRIRVVVFALLLILVASTQISGRRSAIAAPNDDLLAAVSQGRLDRSLYDQINSTGSADGIMTITDPDATRVIDQRKAASGLAIDNAPILQQRSDVYTAQKSTATARAAGGAHVIQDYSHFPNQFLHFDNAAALAAVLQDIKVAVRKNGKNKLMLAQSLPMIHQDNAAAGGLTGAGTTVAIIDTQVEFPTATDLGSCTAVATPASCRVIARQNFAGGGAATPGSDPHGENVASIAARVAPGTNIAALNVFPDPVFLGADDADIQDALNWTVTNQATYNIVAANMSLGDGTRNTSQCTASSYTPVYTNMRAAGILPVVAAGNQAGEGNDFFDYTLTPGISSPACAPGTITVGAVYDANEGIEPGCGTVGIFPNCWPNGIFWGSAPTPCADFSTRQDKIVCFSQAAPYLTVVAPGAFISAGTVSEGGTSQATPHVTGAVAVLRAASPSANVNAVESAIHNSGRVLVDQRFGGLFQPHRLDVCADLQTMGKALSCSPTVIDEKPTNITSTGATLSANVLSSGGSAVTGRGFVYSKTSDSNNPAIGGANVIQTPAGSGTGAFSASISSLTTGTPYTFRAYAINTAGTYYTETFQFTPAATTQPVFTSSDATTFIFGVSSSFTVTTTGSLPMTISQTGPLPTGVTFTDNHDGTATIAGAPGSNLNTRNTLTLKANNGGADVDQGLLFSVLAVQPPTVDAPAHSGLGSSTATIGANVLQDNGATITARGVVYAKSSDSVNPVLGALNVINVPDTSPPGTGAFSESLTGLASSTAYSYRGYATNSAGTTYTIPNNFATNAPATVPTVSSPTKASITANSATLGGNVTSDGGSPILTRGIVYSLTATNPNPQLGGLGVLNVVDSGTTTGVFTDNVTALLPGSGYSFAAYATNAVGPAYSTVDTFTTPALPTLTSPTKTAITSIGATLGANVTNDGNAAVTVRGIVYALTSVNANPQLGGTGVMVMNAGSGTGIFTAVITALTPAKGYSYAGFATNNVGTSYSPVDTFTTLGGLPAVTTPTKTGITNTTATLGANVTSDGGAAVTARGIVYAPTSVNSNPQIGGTGVQQVSAGSGTGVFTAPVTGLALNTNYSYAGFATNSVGTAYSPVDTLMSTNATPPVITSANATTFKVGQVSSFSITTTGNPAPSITRTGSLPTGVNFVDQGNGSGLLSGTPAPGTAGTYPLTFTATNLAGPVQQSFTLTVLAPQPVTLTQTFAVPAIDAGQNTTLTLTLANPNTFPVTGVGFTDTLPGPLASGGGFVLGTPFNATPPNPCGGTLTGMNGGATLTLTGATIPASGNCVFSVTVFGFRVGTAINTTTGPTSNEANQGTPTSNNLQVTQPLGKGITNPVPPVSAPSLAKGFGVGDGQSAPLNTPVSLTFTIKNNNQFFALTGMGFTDTLPPGSNITVAPVPALVNNCAGAIVTALSGTSTITVAGLSLPSNSQCTITVMVQGSTSGKFINTTSTISSAEAGAGNAASAAIIMGTPLGKGA